MCSDAQKSAVGLEKCCRKNHSSFKTDIFIAGTKIQNCEKMMHGWKNGFGCLPFETINYQANYFLDGTFWMIHKWQMHFLDQKLQMTADKLR